MSTSRMLGLLSLTLAVGCASGARTESPTATPLPQWAELVAENESTTPRTLWVQWDGRLPIELGDVDARGANTFRVPLRGNQARFITTRKGGRASRRTQARYLYYEVRSGDRFSTLTRRDGRTYVARLSSY